MTRRLRHIPTRWLAVPAVALAMLLGAGYVFEAASRPERPTRVLVVVDVGAARPPAAGAGLIARASAAARRADAAPGVEAQLRVTRTANEQLSVTHLFAARGYDVVVGAGLDRRVAVDPVAGRFGQTRFVLVGDRELAPAVAAAAR